MEFDKFAFSRTIHRGAERKQREFRSQLFAGEIETTATVLVAALRDQLGNFEFMNWEPDVLSDEVNALFRVKMPLSVRDKLNALIGALTTDNFYKDPLFFNHTCNALDGDPVNMEIFEPATLEEMAWGVLEVGMSDTDGDEPDFAPDIATYVGVALKEYGLKPFDPLGFADDFGVSEGFDFADDPLMVQTQTESRANTKREVLDELKAKVALTHQHLDMLEIDGDRRQKPHRNS